MPHIGHCSEASAEDTHQLPWEARSKPRQRFGNIRTIDRSFTDLGYVGFCDGIDLESLDNCGNWQFH
jgi:serine/threonine-protein kinase SRPK3